MWYHNNSCYKHEKDGRDLLKHIYTYLHGSVLQETDTEMLLLAIKFRVKKKKLQHKFWH